MSLLRLALDCDKSSDPHKVISQLCATADRLGLTVSTTTGKGITVIVGPGDNVTAVIAKHDDAIRSGRKFAVVYGGRAAA